MNNPYAIESPLYVAQVDPKTRGILRAYYFLGNIPKKVLTAARNAKPDRVGSIIPSWSIADSGILRNYYGNNWKDILTPMEPTNNNILQSNIKFSSAPSFFGGAVDFGDLNELDDVKLGDQADTEFGVDNLTEDNESSIMGTRGIPVYTDIATYLEDTIYELRLKTCVATNIELYRQHFFYYVADEGPKIPYRLKIDGSATLVDWTELSELKLDQYYVNRHEGIQISAMDTFTLLGFRPGFFVNRAYFIDLFTVIPPLTTVERPNDNLQASLRDRYMYDLLYYGGVLKYWPHLNHEACGIILTDPSKLSDRYPALNPSIAKLRARFELERVISDIANKWRPSASKSSRSNIAVTLATISILPESWKMLVNIRNVFDWVPTTTTLTAVKAKFSVDTSFISEAGIMITSTDVRQGGHVTITGTKRHISSYVARSSSTVDSFLLKNIKKESLSCAVARPLRISELGKLPYTYLNIFMDGHMEATTSWREDDRISITDATAEVSKLITPIINEINLMESTAFPIGGKLSVPENTGSWNVVSLGSITASIFWPHSLSISAFRELKNRFKDYERAGIISIRGLQQAGAYTFYFKKGIAVYDTKIINRMEITTRKDVQIMQNQYAWLTDEVVSHKWVNAFQGRIVRLHHRATDLRIEVVGAYDLHEFELIQQYVFSFLDGAIAGNNKISTGDNDIYTQDDPSNVSKRLKRLQERDPNLFDLKKYDPSAPVYSILCQSGRQPHILNQKEYSTVKDKRKKKISKYWNFTNNEPAYYECPDPKYPYLSFRSGYHQLGYCLPCCKKTFPLPGSKSANVTSACLNKYSDNPTKPNSEDVDEEDDTSSRHVLTYGKNIPVGRISEVPKEISDGLFLNIIDQPYGAYLVGVEQSVPAVPIAGFAYALAYAISNDSSTADEILGELANLAAEFGDTYYALGSGDGSNFTSATELADAIRETFIRKEPTLSKFGPGGSAADSWHNILADLARHIYGIEVVMLNDSTGSGSILLEAMPEAATAIIGDTAFSIMGEEASLTIVKPRLAIIVSNPTGYYPLAILNPRFYSRVAIPFRWMIARRNFGDEIGAEGELVKDTIYGIVKDVLVEYSTKTNECIDLNLVMRYLDTKEAGFIMDIRLVNTRNICYGVIIRSKTDSSSVYIPVTYSAYALNGIPIKFGTIPSLKFSKLTLMAAVEEINNYILKNSEPYNRIVKSKNIINSDGQVIGFSTLGEFSLYFIHDPHVNTNTVHTSIKVATANPTGTNPNIDNINFPYDISEIDTAILDRSKKSTDLQYIQAEYKNRLYNLFLVEFSTTLRKEKNVEMRKKLYTLLKSTTFSVANSVHELWEKLRKLLHSYINDLIAMRDIITKSYVIRTDNPLQVILGILDSTHFEFDRQTLSRLSTIVEKPSLIQELKKIMKYHITILDDIKYTELRNIYVSCGESSSLYYDGGQCIGNKLAVPTSRVDDLYDILASDIQNSSKFGIISSVSTGVFDSMSFIRRQNEHLKVTIGV